MITLALIFIFLGLLIRFTNFRNLIAGYYTLPIEEKQKIDIISMSAFLGNNLVIMGILFLIGSLLSQWLEQPKINDFFLFGTLIIMLPYMLFNANSDKFKV